MLVHFGNLMLSYYLMIPRFVRIDQAPGNVRAAHQALGNHTTDVSSGIFQSGHSDWPLPGVRRGGTEVHGASAAPGESCGISSGTNVLVVQGLVVDPKHRGAGVGGMLMQSALASLASTYRQRPGGGAVHVYLSCSGAGLVQFYSTCGFRVAPPHPFLPQEFFSSVGGASGENSKDESVYPVTWMYRRA